MEGAMGYDRDVESLKATELRLGLPGTTEERSTSTTTRAGNKRKLAEANEDARSTETKSSSEAPGLEGTGDEASPPNAKARIVGWPPVRSCMKNIFHARKTEDEARGVLVKVGMDGVPYLRKIDLKAYKGYKELREALGNMFKCFSIGNEGCSGSDYAITYEDKDGDWMLVGDVPWEMFFTSCKRLRIMRGYEARGFVPNP
ncbi:auxin-induced protein 22D-like [Iris pallida]|uniref:Auxin-responsive protein n=1 Tax=Iris pallida TaxID=29817 RepID=A0AAX6HDF5_IRIPA|nr:auxin-induced protein 22D-like [Iris pallida]